MSNLSDIKRRLSTVKQTRQITGAMQTVSVAKMRKAEEINNRSAAYLTLITDIMRNINGCECGFTVAPADGKDVLLVLSSDRGLCGGFDNGNFSVAEKVIDDHTLVMPIGQTAVNYYKSAKNVDLRFAIASAAGAGLAKEITDYLLKLYGNGVKSISVVYSTVSKQFVCPKCERLLPIENTVNGNGTETLFEPSPRQVLEALVPLYLSGKIYGALTADYAAEQCARHQAMTAATESADALISQLSSEYNRERQATVTGQIVEIVGATAALSRKGEGSEKRF